MLSDQRSSAQTQHTLLHLPVSTTGYTLPVPVNKSGYTIPVPVYILGFTLPDKHEGRYDSYHK